MEPNFAEVERIIAASLAEDVGTGDATAQLLIPETATARLSFINREPMVMAGGFLVPRVFAQVDKAIKTTVNVAEGVKVEARTELIRVEGNARAILTAERVALNLLQRMASVATVAAAYVEAVRGTKAVILDTRKTMPGLRVLDKYAVCAGGATNHRMRLDDGILIKDNHIAVCGSVALALQRAQAGNKNNLPIEVECDTLQQMEEALAAGATLIMLDNMSPAMMREAVRINAGRAKLEASGNVDIDNVREVAETGVDFVSIGRLTNSVKNVDIGLDSIVEK
ncbi:MAG TPA: carboxylating nicotinate-nucleotide diphosphorylase [Rickettsiales bacterium]|nr:carboxylating nicotinate-nucleotide diphosphorylase [Rickettsiales bacterium]